MANGDVGAAALSLLIKEIGLLPLGVVILLLLFPMGVTSFVLYKLNDVLERIAVSSDRNTDLLRNILQEVK